MKRRASVLLLTLVLGCGSPPPAPDAPAAEGAFRLTILHTNDIHGQVLPPARRAGGLVALGRTIRQERDAARARGDAVLLLDAGDLFKGTPEGDLTDGEVVVAWMNHLGYDALAVGNHEFDHGLEVVERLARAARFPVLGANVRPAPPWLGRGAEPPSEALRGAAVVRTLESRGGRARVAIVGLTTSGMKDVTLAGVTGDLAFDAEAAALERVLGLLPPVDLVVLLTHCGVDVDRALARRFDGRVHLIVGGHSHTRLPEGERVGSVLIAQTGERTQSLGRVHVERAGERVAARADLVEAGDDLEAQLAPYVERVRAKVDEPVGRLERSLLREPGYASSALGNLHVDLMRAATGADVAFHNKTGIRADMTEGEVKYRHVYEVAPFGNTVVTLRLRGADLRDLVAGMLSATPRLLEVSGAVVACDPEAPEARRLLELHVGGRPLDPEKTYLVATNNFLAAGGDGHVAFTRGSDVKHTPIVLLDLLLAHFRRHVPFDPGQEADPRIVVVKAAPTPR